MSEPVLSYELKNLLDTIKNSMVNEFPINTITLNYFILAILDNTNCDAYSILTKIMMSTTINEFKEFIISLVLVDCQTDMLTNEKSEFSDEYEKIAETISAGGKTVTSALLFNEIVKNTDVIRKKLKSLGVTIDEINDVVLAYGNTKKDEIKPSRKSKRKSTHKNEQDSKKPDMPKQIPDESNYVESNCVNLVRNASKGMYDKIIGFDNVINDIFDVLGKYDRNIAAIVGPNGVGKTSVVHRLAKRIYDNDCPPMFRNKYIMEFGDSINVSILNDMNRIGKYIAFIDDLERLFINKESEMNNIYVLTELFKSPNISTVICMNDDLYTKHIESKPSLSRYIQKIVIKEPEHDSLSEIISSSGMSICDYNSVTCNKETINECIRLANKFISCEKSPKAALNILDSACSHARVSENEPVELIELRKKLEDIKSKMNEIPNSAGSDEFDMKDKLTRDEIAVNAEIAKFVASEADKTIDLSINDVRYAVSKMTGIPIDEMDSDERKKLKSLYENLTAHVIGQDDAVSDICRAVKRQRVGLGNPNKPCVMMFIGSTGTGKCVCGDTIIKIRNKKTNEIQEITLNELKKLRLTQQN